MTIGYGRNRSYTYKTYSCRKREKNQLKSKPSRQEPITSQIQYSEDGENWMAVGSNRCEIYIYTVDAKGDVPKTIETAGIHRKSYQYQYGKYI